MDPQEIRDKIMAAINGIIKDDSEKATTDLHDVLAAKMRSRINPSQDEPDDTTVNLDGEPPQDDPETTPTE